MQHHRRTPTQHRTAYQTHHPAPPTAVTAILAALPLAAMYLLTHPAVAATMLVAASLMAGTMVRTNRN